MIIKNKIESLDKIKQLKLNQLPEIYFDGFDEEKVKNWLNLNRANFYAVRDKSVAMSNLHKMAVRFDEVIDYCKQNNLQRFTLNVSSFNYKENQLCAGEICIEENFLVNYILSYQKGVSVRDCYANPDVKGSVDMLDSKFKYIKHLDKIVDYALKNNLVGVIVEFTIFDLPVGINKQNIVIWELRTDY